MDIVFGWKSFRNEIVWCYTSPSNTKRYFPKKHDIILFYSKSDDWIFNGDEVKVPYRKRMTGTSKKGIFKENAELDMSGKIKEDWWEDITIAGRIREEHLGYPTQKPLKLLKRIIQASCPEGGVVLDPFCGCATTCVVAEGLEREWIGIDTSIKAYELVKKRLTEEVSNPEDLLKYEKEITFSTGIPERTDGEGEEGGRLRKWIYVISNQKFLGEYKVGIAKDWKSRLNSYQTSDPDRGFQMEYCELTDRFREVEEHIHKRFKNKHEWIIGELKRIIEEIKKFLSS